MREKYCFMCGSYYWTNDETPVACGTCTYKKLESWQIYLLERMIRDMGFELNEEAKTE